MNHVYIICMCIYACICTKPGAVLKHESGGPRSGDSELGVVASMNSYEVFKIGQAHARTGAWGLGGPFRR